MAYVENPIVEGKDFESVMGDVNGNFSELKQEVFDKGVFRKIGEYKFKRVTQSVSKSASSVVVPSSTKYEIYQIKDGDMILLDSDTTTGNGGIREVQVSVLPFEQILIFVNLEVGRAMHASFQADPLTCLSDTTLSQTLGSPSISTDHKWADESDELQTTAKTPSYSRRYTYYAKGTPFLESEGNSFTNDKERTFSLKLNIHSKGVADDKSYYYNWLTDVNGNLVSTNKTYSYLSENPEECYGVIDVAIYAIPSIVSNFNGIDWDNPWTET